VFLLRITHVEYSLRLYEISVKSGEARNRESEGAIADLKWFSIDQLPTNLACFTVPAIDHLLNRSNS